MQRFLLSLLGILALACGLRCTPKAPCTLGAARCQGSQAQRCELDGSWINVSCAANHSCQQDRCQPDIVTDAASQETIPTPDMPNTPDPPPGADMNAPCPPNTSKCEANTAWTCLADGTWEVLPCSPSQTCIDGICKTKTSPCTTGSQRCAGEAIEICQDDQTWKLTNCPQGQQCSQDQCTGTNTPCVAGTKRCNAQAVEICQTDGSWTSQSCPSGEECKEGVCQPPACSPAGEQVCKDAQTLQVCLGDGRWQSQPCPAKEECRMGRCQAQTVCQQGQQRACYEGPPNTAGVGLCQQGTQHCNAAGSWGMCQKEVKPQPELCDGKDNNCNGQVDEKLQRPCQNPCGTGQEMCNAGAWKGCTAPSPKPEVCNHKDDDCNGKIDDNINPPCCPAGAFCQQANGIFFTPTQAEPSKQFNLLPPVGSYSRLTLTFEVKHNGWNNEPNGKRFTTFWLEHNDKFFDLYGYLIFNKPNNIILRHGFGLTPTQKPKITKQATMTAGLLYQINYDYDTKQSAITAEVWTQGKLLARLADKPNITSITFTNKQTLSLSFSNGNADPNEPPSYGWEYQNARLILYP